MTVHEVIQQVPAAFRAEAKELLKKFPEDDFLMIRQYKTNTAFIEEGAVSTTVYILLKGAASGFWTCSGVGQYIVRYDKPLTIIGDAAPLANLEHCSITMKTTAPTTFIVMDRNVFLHWMEQDLALYRNLVASNLKMFMRQQTHYRTLVLQPTDIRILKYLLWIYDTTGSPAPAELVVSKKREEMVDDIGDISLRTLNRYLSTFHEQELISIHRGKVKLSAQQAKQIRKLLDSQPT